MQEKFVSSIVTCNFILISQLTLNFFWNLNPTIFPGKLVIHQLPCLCLCTNNCLSSELVGYSDLLKHKDAEIADIRRQLSDEKEFARQGLNTLIISLQKLPSRQVIIIDKEGSVNDKEGVNDNGGVWLGKMYHCFLSAKLARVDPVGNLICSTWTMAHTYNLKLCLGGFWCFFPSSWFHFKITPNINQYFLKNSHYFFLKKK